MAPLRAGQRPRRLPRRLAALPPSELGRLRVRLGLHFADRRLETAFLEDVLRPLCFDRLGTQLLDVDALDRMQELGRSSDQLAHLRRESEMEVVAHRMATGAGRVAAVE